MGDFRNFLVFLLKVNALANQQHVDATNFTGLFLYSSSSLCLINYKALTVFFLIYLIPLALLLSLNHLAYFIMENCHYII